MSGALRRDDVLEPWLTESHWDEGYWDNEARGIVERLGPDPTREEVRAAVSTTLTDAFPSGGFRPEFEQLVDRIADQLESP